MCQNRLKRDKKKLKDAEANVSKALRTKWFSQLYLVHKMLIISNIIEIIWRNSRTQKMSAKVLTWSSNRALSVIFFLLNESVNSSTVMGSSNASGPSSDIGGTEVGCTNKIVTGRIN